MKVLKDRIYQALIEKITVSEFENWLYNSEEILSKLDSNPFNFDLISINYTDDEWKTELGQLIEKDILILSETENLCIEIRESEKLEVCGKLVSELVYLLSDKSFEETEYIAVYNFHSLNSRYDLIKLNYMKGSDFVSEAKYYSNILLEKLRNFESLSDKIEVLKSNFEEDMFLRKKAKVPQNNNSESSKKVSYMSKNSTLIQKIFAFFKKI